MTLDERLTEDMKTSMKAGNAARTGVLRLLRGAIKNEELKTGTPLDEAGRVKVLQREAKQRRDSIAAYSEAGRTDLSEAEEQELVIVAEYLPAVMNDAELEQVVAAVISETGATELKQLGSVIGAVMSRVGARADGGRVSALVRQRLGS